jgi:hypothetical protein
MGLHRGRRALGLAVLAVMGFALLSRVVGQDELTVATPRVLEPLPPPTVPTQASRAPVRRPAGGRPTRGKSTGHFQAPLQPATPVASPPAPPATVSAERPVDPPPAALALAAPPPEPAAEPELSDAPAEPPAQPPPEPEAQADSDTNGDSRGESIARAIADEKRAAVRKCFEQELKQQPKLAGTVTVELDLVAPDRVEALRVRDDLNRPEFTRCVTSAMQGVRFAALDEDLSVQVPYTLRPVPH